MASPGSAAREPNAVGVVGVGVGGGAGSFPCFTGVMRLVGAAAVGSEGRLGPRCQRCMCSNRARTQRALIELYIAVVGGMDVDVYECAFTHGASEDQGT